MVPERPAINAALARRLVDTQFPQWRDRPLVRLEPAGSDHVIYRLGDDLTARLPAHPGAIDQAAKEASWLPRLAPRLPLAIPEPVAVGRPGFGYPWPWAVARWLPGSVATAAELGASVPAARELAGFLAALYRSEIPAGAAGLARPPLADRDRETRAAIADLAGAFDAEALTRVWEQALGAPRWDRPPVWVHGDFHTGNLLTAGGRLSAVLDFGSLGVGDPSSDLQIAYSLLDPAPRAAFRAALALDEDTWARGRGWTLTGGLLAYRAYAAADERIAAQTTRQITAALADAARPRLP